MSLKRTRTSLPGFPMSLSTSSQTCSGATFIWPETWSATTESRYLAPFLVSATTMSWRIPEAMKTLRTPSTEDTSSSSLICPEWSIGSLGHGLPPRHLLSSHLPFACFLAHSMPYMLAVGPPTSRMTPSNPGEEAILRTSSMMEPSDLETTVVP